MKFEIAFFESKVSLTSIFGDKKTKKGAILNAKTLVCSVDAPSVPMSRKTKSKQETPEYQLIIQVFGMPRVWQ